MRLDPLLDAVSLLSALWAGAGPQVCPASPSPANLALATSSPELGAPGAVTAFVDVHVIPMDTERVLAHQTVLVAGGRITALGPTDQVPVPAGAVRIDGRGKYLMPGLADMHHHHPLSDLEERQFAVLQNHLFRKLAMGVTTIRELNGGHALHVMRRWQDSTAVKFPLPRIYFAPPLRGWTPLDSMRAAVAGAEALGYDHITTPYAMRVDSLEGRAKFDSLLAAARRAGLPLAAHTHFLPFDAALTLGTAGGSTEHLYPYFTVLGSRKSVSQQQALDVPMPKLQALAAATRRAGLWITPTLQCSEHTYSSHTQLMRQLVKALQGAGVGLLLAADDDWDVHHELAALVRAGLTSYQALVTGTRNPAQYLGKLDSSGTVAVGKRADLVLLSGNPLEDVRHAREPAGVMIRGRWLDRVTLDQRLLASPGPKVWFQSLLRQRNVQRSLTNEQRNRYKVHIQAFAALTDSLTAAQTASDRPAAERVRRQLAAELGALRTLLGLEQRALFDPAVRVWLRAQARQGHPATVPGVTPLP